MLIQLKQDVERKCGYSALKTDVYLAKTQGAADPFPLIPDPVERVKCQFAQATQSPEHAVQATRYTAMVVNGAHDASKRAMLEKYADNFIRSAKALPSKKAQPVLTAFADEIAHLLNFNNNYFVPPVCLKVIDKLNKCAELKDYTLVLGQQQYEEAELQMRLINPKRKPNASMVFVPAVTG